MQRNMRMCKLLRMLCFLLTSPEQHSEPYILNCIFHEKYIEYLVIN